MTKLQFVESLKYVFTIGISTAILVSSQPGLRAEQARLAFADVITSRTIKEHSVHVPYWSTEAGEQSIVHLHNNFVAGPLTVTATFRSVDGRGVSLNPIVIGPNGNASIDLASELAPYNWLSQSDGSATFSYSGLSGGELSAEISVTHAARTLKYTIVGTEDPADPSQLNSAFWLASGKSEVYVAVQNPNSTAESVALEVYVGDEHIKLGAFPLSPYGSKVFSFPEDLPSRVAAQALWKDGQTGGVLVRPVNGHAITASGWIEDETTGYSNMMTFTDASKARNSRLMSPQILFGRQDSLLKGESIASHLVVRNLSDNLLHLAGKLAFEAEDGQLKTVDLPLSDLGRHQITHLDLAGMQQKGSVPASVTSASLVVSHTGAPGDAIGRVFGVSEDSSFGLYWALESYAPAAVREIYWSATKGDTSLLTVGNFGDQPTTVFIDAYVGNRTVRLKSVDLKPLQETSLDVQAPPQLGNPAEGGSGSIHVYTDSLKSQILVREHIVNFYERTSAPFYGITQWAVGYTLSGTSCGNCFFITNPEPVAVGEIGLTYPVFIMNDGSFRSAGVTSWDNSDGNGSFNNITYQVTANYVAADSMVFAGISDETVVDSNGDQDTVQGSKAVDIRYPKSIAATNTGLAVVCSGQFDHGFKIDVTYQLYDNATPRKAFDRAGLGGWEKISNVMLDGASHPELSHDWSQTLGNTDSGGKFHDSPYGYCSLDPSIYTNTQEISFVLGPTRYPVRTNSVSFHTTGPGTGTMTNGSDASMTR